MSFPARNGVARDVSATAPFLQTTHDGAWVLDDQARVVSVNARGATMLGLEPEDALGRSFLEYVADQDVAMARDVLVGGAAEPWARQPLRLRDRAGSELWTLASSASFEPSGGEQATLVMIADVSDHRRAVVELTVLAQRDPLTGLAGRRLLEDRLRRALVEAPAAGPGPAVLFVDLDRFDVLGAQLGRAGSEELLCAVAQRLEHVGEAWGTVARFERDEFVVLCDRVDGLETAARRAEAALEALQHPLSTARGEQSVVASVGVALADGGAHSPEALVAEAEAAMRRVKARGGGGYEIADPGLRARLLAEAALDADLRHAPLRERMRLVYQPIVALDGFSAPGLEVLLRWEQPGRGAVAPRDLVAAAERTGTVLAIGMEVLELACEQALSWSRRDGAACAGISVNVSPLQLQDRTFVRSVATVLEATGFDPGAISLEIAERALLAGDGVARTLEGLHALGTRIVIDDFGAGAGALKSVRDVPLTGLKIDRSLVADIGGANGSSLPIVEAVVGIGRALGLELTAAGVETLPQLEAIRELGCDRAQGYLFARPLAPEDVPDWLDRASPVVAPAATAAVEEPATVTLKEAAGTLGVSTSTFRRWADAGRVQAVRTPGGHRRFAVADVRRLAREAGPRARLQPAALPGSALPALAEAIERHGASLAEIASSSIYAGRGHGWYASGAAQAELRAWAGALVLACRRGEYEGAVAAARKLARRAQLGGATRLEQHLFAERYGAAAKRLLSRANAPERELTESARLFTALRHATLGDEG
jgi:diguanylate cyclase (GGDEF)-like protein/PAS domain S-box-containing protein/excisionase family DNA binding protein